uniref:Uncharacterized protein n=1 Tax=Pavo cristatus TaxID=9049 RepID=A0A8C9FS16_PAVCR
CSGGRPGGVALLLGAVLGPLAASVFSSSPVGSPGEPRSRVQVLSGSNWSLVLQGQWMTKRPVKEDTAHQLLNLCSFINASTAAQSFILLQY